MRFLKVERHQRTRDGNSLCTWETSRRKMRCWISFWLHLLHARLIMIQENYYYNFVPFFFAAAMNVQHNWNAFKRHQDKVFGKKKNIVTHKMGKFFFIHQRAKNQHIFFNETSLSKRTKNVLTAKRATDEIFEFINGNMISII